MPARTAAAGFTPLHVESDGSLLRGCVTVAEWTDLAARLGHRALALADLDSMAHAVTFQDLARSHGLRPLFGLAVERAGCAALLLARDRRGFARLCELATLAALEPGADLGAGLLEDAAGLFILSDHEPTLERLAPLAEGTVFTRLRAGRSAPALAAHAARLSRATRRPLVATGEARVHDPRDRELRRLVASMRLHTLAARLRLDEVAPLHARLLDPREALREFERFPNALRRNLELAEACRVELSTGRPIFPAARGPEGTEPLEHLRSLCEVGLSRRYAPGRRGEARARLRHELSQIHTQGFTPYFLLVADILGFARGRGIPSVGRGSGASSLVTYTLGITNVDPLEHGLRFERFLHPERPDCPDLDIDLCWIRRDEVIEYACRAYGADRTAMLGTHATFGFRFALRECLKAMGVGPEEAQQLASHAPRELGPAGAALPVTGSEFALPSRGDANSPAARTLRDAGAAAVLAALRAHAPSARVNWNEPVRLRALAAAARLEGRLAHMGMHPGGVVIADRPLTHYLALTRSAKGTIITQCEMRAAEALGLVKLDLLGNRAVTEIGDTLATLPAAARARAQHPPDADPETVALLGAGETLSCFQLESPAMRNLLRQLGPTCLADTILSVALIRPGAADSGMRERFIRRRRGLEPVEFLHPCVREALGSTLGLLVYEEDVMTVAAAVLGRTLADGDLVRRAIGGARCEQERESLGRTFVARAQARGIGADQGRAIWEALSRFAAYAFCKAHAAGYGVLAWQAAYLKAHHPAEFACAVANHHQGMYPRWVHLEEARRRGVRVLGPCLNRSAEPFSLETREPCAFSQEPEGPTTRAVRAGLACVSAVPEGARAQILAERAAGGPFLELADFLGRVRMPERECRALVDAGALDFTGRTRASVQFELAATHAAYAGAQPEGLFRARRAPCAVPVLPEFAALERLRREMKTAGFAVSMPLLSPWAAARTRAGVVDAQALPDLLGQPVRVAGLPCALRRVRTRTGSMMLFLSLWDDTGPIECTFFSGGADLHPPMDEGPLLVEGTVEEQLGAFTLTARRWQRLPATGDAGRTRPEGPRLSAAG